MNRDHGLFGAFGDKVITEKELRETAEDPDAPLELKRAARYVLDHPDLMERLSRSRDGGDHGIARSDVDLVMEENRTGGADELPGTDGATGASGSGGAAGRGRRWRRRALGAADAPRELRRSERTELRAASPDKVLSREELRGRPATPDTSPALKRALRYVLDHPDLLDSLSRSQGCGDPGHLAERPPDRDRGRAALDRARRPYAAEEHRRLPKTTADLEREHGVDRSPRAAPAAGASDPSITDILNDKSLSVEEKIEMILMVLENRTDDQMLSVTQQLDQNDDKKSAKDDRKKVAKLDKVDRDLNFKMERLMKRKEQLSNLLSTMEMKFASMAQTAIANMGR